jgi:hypothetical protein
MSNHHKLAAAAHYVIARTKPPELGAVKLNKILWFSDLAHYREHGTSVTGLTAYIRMPRGPVPEGMSQVLEHLERDGAIVERRQRVIDYYRREFVWIKEPDLALFTATEIDTLNVYIDLVRPQPANFISDVTHEDALWQELKDGDLMPIGAGAVVPREPSPADLEWAQAQIRAA